MVRSPGASLRTCCAFSALLVLVLAFGVFGMSLQRTYTWQHEGREWKIDYAFDSDLYAYYRGIARTIPYTAYDAYVVDPHDDETLHGFALALDALGMGAGMNVYERLNLVIAFVQSIPYASEVCEYPRYPIEMLIDGRGDCEDAAILAASLVRELGFDVVLLAFLEESHMALGIRVVPPDAATKQAYLWQGERYYYLEPTSPGWTIGVRPQQYQSEPRIIDLLSAYATESR